MGLNIDALPNEPEAFKGYLSALDDDQLQKLHASLDARWDDTYGDGNDLSSEAVDQLQAFTDQIEIVKGVKAEREKAALQVEAEEARAAQQKVVAKMRKQVKASNETDEGGDGGQGSTAVATLERPEGDAPQAFDAEAFADNLNQAMANLVVKSQAYDLNKHLRNNPSLTAAAGYAPDPKVQPKRDEPVIVASSDVPGLKYGSKIDTFSNLVNVMHQRARMLQPTRLGSKANRVPVATLERDFRYELALDSNPGEVDEVLRAATNVDALVAAGGWCAPSEISYDFYNIVSEDGLIDLPTVGVLNRGGLRFPISPDISDVLGSTGLWSWTEAQDEAAVDSDSELKTCVRIDCPDFDEVRAACDGLCVTVGNLVDFAYPELVQNTIRLIFAARAHLTNQSIIQQLVGSGITATVDLTGGMGAVGAGAAWSVLSAIELQVEDYRSKFRMPLNSVLEGVFPHWAYGVVRADLANRNGVDFLSVSNAQIADWFNERGVRAQFVYDWQSGFTGDPFGDSATNAIAWPDSVDFLLYAAGTFVRGQGLQLDLGVVRDSVLNQTNDHTGAWMEDCFAVAAVGHEARLVTVSTCVAGETGAADVVCAS